ncbi:tail sheath protein gp18 [Serratia sp. FS14]|nr:tail sheath protein gp18 [Serratia sp. FS14]
MADYTVPGVYVEEPFGLSLSIQTGQTATPVFAFDNGNKLATEMVATDKVTEWVLSH